VSSLHPAAIYGVLALLSAVENIIPPVPSDAAVALGAFLSQRGVTTPLGVFLVTWTANLAGAAGVYFGVRRYGRRLFASRLGPRLLVPRSLAIIEREYLRFGVVGIFLSRFLPGIRAVVPPFAGLVGLGAVRTLVPMGLASALWYGGIIMLGALIGSEWNRINDLIAGLNRTLALIAVGAVVGWLVWRRLTRGRRHRERIWNAIGEALHPAPSFLRGTEVGEGSARQAAALLVLELAYADSALAPDERDLVTSHLRDRWELPRGGEPPEPAPEHERRTRFAGYAARLRRRIGRAQRLDLVERMWAVAFSDGAIGAHEERLMHLAGEALGISPAELADVRHRLAGARGS